MEQETIFQETTATDIGAEQGQEREQEQGEPEGQIGLNEDGSIDFPESFFEGLGLPVVETKGAAEVTAAVPEPPKPTFYTPDEFAAAFAGGAVDEEKLSPEVKEFYAAAAKHMPQVQPQPVVQPPVQAPAAGMTSEQYAQLRDVAKQVAARNYLGIKAEEFDEFDPTHAQAQNFAMQQIQARAQAVAAERRAESARANQVVSHIQAMDADYRAKDPEFFNRSGELMQDFLSRAPYKEATAHIQAVQTGDIEGIRKFVAAVHADFRKGGKQGEPNVKQIPPRVMAAGSSAPESRGGYADASKLGDMSPEEKADWFVKNGIVSL